MNNIIVIIDTRQHDVIIYILAEAIASGETNIRTSYLSRYIKSLQSNYTTDSDIGGTWQLLQRHWEQVTSTKPRETSFRAATLPANQLKNQSFDFLPMDSSRVKLPLLKDVEGSDYINASWIPGFHSLNEFILTQHPKESTTGDFWRLIWEQDVHTVVVLSPITEPDLHIFWPENDSLRIGQLKIKHTEEGLLSGFQTKDFRLECGDRSTPRVVRVVFSPGWRCSQPSLVEEESVALVPVIQSRQDNLPPRPLLVLDRDGGSQAATFCALSNLFRYNENI